jgi:hypothetical protein
VSVDLADLPMKGPCIFQVASADGRTEQAAAWATTPTATAIVTGASSFALPNIRVISVLDRTGRVLATTGPV